MRYKKLHEDRHDSDSVTYDDSKKDKTIATVTGRVSERYTKLTKMIAEVKKKEKEVAELKKQINTKAFEGFDDLFNASDRVKTCVIKTVSLSVQLSKATEAKSVKYAKVLEELSEHLTPELSEMMDELLEKYTSTVKRASTLKYDLNESVIVEGFLDKLKAWFAKFLDHVKKWCKTYESQLDRLQAELDSGKE